MDDDEYDPMAPVVVIRSPNLDDESVEDQALQAIIAQEEALQEEGAEITTAGQGGTIEQGQEGLEEDAENELEIDEDDEEMPVDAMIDADEDDEADEEADEDFEPEDVGTEPVQGEASAAATAAAEAALPQNVDLQALLAGFQQQQQPAAAAAAATVAVPATLEPGQASGEEAIPLTPQEEVLYENFLEEEREVVSAGRWDQFPSGSRMFVGEFRSLRYLTAGNLPSERVTKKDVFRVFYRYGRMAQISIKQAYGFVQYYTNEVCNQAIQAEEGTEIRGRKIREITS